MVGAIGKWLAMCSEALADGLRQGRLRFFHASPDRRRRRCDAPLRPKDARHQSPQQGDKEINMAKGGGVVEHGELAFGSKPKPKRDIGPGSAGLIFAVALAGLGTWR
jgi:hypothetical protein